MKKIKLSFVGFGLLLLIASCKKQDVPNQPLSSVQSTNAVKQDWVALSNWTSDKQDKFTTNSASIQNASLTQAVIDSGLVLVYKKGSDIQTLPYQEKGTNEIYWYYQVSKGSLRINNDNYGGSQNLSSQSFSYFILTPQQLSNLQSGGKSRSDLLQLSYNEAAALLK